MAFEGEDDFIKRARVLEGRALRGKYSLEKLIGMGGMAAVYRGSHRNGNKVAVKVLHAELSVHRDIRERFLREGYIANKVQHPGVVHVIDDDVDEDGSVFIVMELLDGESLEAHIARRGGQLEAAEAVDFACQTLDVLAAAHDNGIIHRDLKPENLFVLRAEGSLKVLDFGIARVSDTARSATKTGRVMGTPGYMAPEQARGEMKLVDARTDIWAIGAILYRALKGAPVHDAETPELMLIHAATQPAPSLKKELPEVSAALAEIVDRALERSMDARWKSAGAMATALRGLSPEEVGGATIRPTHAVVEPPASDAVHPFESTLQAKRETESPRTTEPLPRTTEPVPRTTEPLPRVAEPLAPTTEPLAAPPPSFIQDDTAPLIARVTAAVATERSAEATAVATERSAERAPVPSEQIASTERGEVAVPSDESEEETLAVPEPHAPHPHLLHAHDEDEPPTLSKKPAPSDKTMADATSPDGYDDEETETIVNLSSERETTAPRTVPLPAAAPQDVGSHARPLHELEFDEETEFVEPLPSALAPHSSPERTPAIRRVSTTMGLETRAPHVEEGSNRAFLRRLAAIVGAAALAIVVIGLFMGPKEAATTTTPPPADTTTPSPIASSTTTRVNDPSPSVSGRAEPPAVGAGTGAAQRGATGPTSTADAAAQAK